VGIQVNEEADKIAKESLKQNERTKYKHVTYLVEQKGNILF